MNDVDNNTKERFGWVRDEDGTLYLRHYYKPTFSIKMDNARDKYTLMESLREAADWINGINGRYIDSREAMNAKIDGIHKAIRDVEKLSDSIIQIGGIMERIDVHSKEYENLLPRYSRSLYMINRKKSAVVKRINNFSRDYGGGERFDDYDKAIDYFNKFVSEQNKTE